jgi:dTDP-4-amino-4,6-dideoxygalactose transaminase
VIPIARPQLGEEEKRSVWAALESGSLAQGVRVRQLEEEFAAFVGVPHAGATAPAPRHCTWPCWRPGWGMATRS